MRNILKYQGLTLLWGLFILFLCSISFGEIAKSKFFFPGFDKLTHCGLFFVFTVFMCSGLIRSNHRYRLTYSYIFWSLVIPILFGGLIELLQLYIFTWRSGEWGDLFADGVGTGMGVFSVLITIWSVNYGKKLD